MTMAGTRWGERDERAYTTLRTHGATVEQATSIVEQQRKARHAAKRVIVSNEKAMRRVTTTRVTVDADGKTVANTTAVPEQGWHRPYRVVGSTHIGSRQTAPADFASDHSGRQLVSF